MQLNLKQAARFLDVSEEQLHDWIDEQAIPFSREGGLIRFNQAELLEWATARNLRTAQSSEGADAPSLAAALELGGVHRALSATDRDSAIRAAVGRLPAGPAADPETLVEILLAREAAGTTAVGDGLAIPHVRAPIVQHGARPLIALCTLAQPIDFGARDGKPVHTLFLLATPTVDVHLKLLSRLAAALHDAAFKDAVVRRAPAAEILEHARRVDAAVKGR
jgi:nitrogen PTS system EIIA component